MKTLHRLLLWCIFISPITSYGQNFKFIDSFDDNRYNWYQGEKEGGRVHITNGKLIISCDNGWSESIRPYMEFEKDFIFQATFKQIDGKDNNGVGLMWGNSTSEKDRNYFMVNAMGSFYIGDNSVEMNTKKPGIREWTKSTSIKGMGQENVLKVEQKTGSINFYVNGTRVFTGPVLHWRGSSIGVITYVNMTFEVDDFSFEQQGIKINLPPNYQPQGFKKENLGANINTAADDLSPVISVDGKHLYFGREYYDGNLGGTSDGEDIWVSTFDGNEWGPAQNLGSPLNSTTVDNLLAVSADNNSMLFSDAGQFLVKKRTSTGWGGADPMGIHFTNEGDNFESCLSADGKAVLFTARNKDNLFYHIKDNLERDIFVSYQDQTGTWTAPINLGKDINTYRDELSVFLAADGRTLYFSTNGRPGYGSYDVFVSKRIGDGWTRWSEPVNLGPEINSTGFDAYYVIPASGDVAYMVSNIGGMGKTDIVRIRQPKQTKETKPDPVVLVRGKTLDAKSKNPISADIHIDNLLTQKEVGEGISDPATGDFKFVLPYGSNYGFHASATGYLSVNENLELISVSSYAEIEKNLLMVPIEVGANIKLNNVFFVQGKAVLLPESYPELDRLVIILKENPTIEIQLKGYTDNANRNEPKNIQLSTDRVNSVKKYMTDKGIESRRITTKGFGSANPIEPNTTEPNRRKNRRVEFSVTKK